MKKKGLIVATIVMVLVLAVSLTTATYAWFTVSDATSIEGFKLSVTAGNAINIGLNAEGYTTYSPSASADSFVSGAVSYFDNQTAGSFADGYWTGGNPGLGATIEHDIQWGAQSKAVGFTTEEELTSVGLTNTGFAGNNEKSGLDAWKKVIAANGVAQTDMQGKAFAYANRKSDDEGVAGNGDYVYMFLGAQPTKLLTDGTNKLYIVIQVQGTGTTIGMAAAIHVAYKVNEATTWKDVDVWGDKSYSDKKDGNNVVIFGNYAGSSDLEGGSSAQILADTDAAGTDNKYAGLYQTTFSNAAAVVINLSDYNANSTSVPLDQIQLLIYIAGADKDCRDEAKAGEIGVGIFFGAQEATTTTDET